MVFEQDLRHLSNFVDDRGNKASVLDVKDGLSLSLGLLLFFSDGWEGK